MLTDKYLEESGDEVSNEFSTLETVLLVWMGLRLRNLSNIENIGNDYPKWKNKAIAEFNKYSGTEFGKTKKTSLDMVKNAVVNGVTLTIENVYNRLKKTDDKLKKKNILINGKKDLTTLVETKDFAFDLNVNMAHNVSKVKELAPEENVNYMFFNIGRAHV